ncbi:MAG: helix-turn-helix domain-containing protein [Prevotellaceae bacterium]|nr:helix-turn-helix domain-containing protein [Prevotellaceae bacterium]
MREQNINFERVEQYNEWAHVETLHPLVSTFHYPDYLTVNAHIAHFKFYAIFLKIGMNGDIYYGNRKYDYKDGSLIFTKPGQIADLRHRGITYNPSGRVLIFHPDFLLGTPLAEKMKNFTFFSYDANEALILTPREREIVNQLYANIEEELHDMESLHRDQLIIANLELLLTYCVRFYDRQFATRSKENHSAISKLERLIYDYFSSKKPKYENYPNIQYYAEKLHLSPNYFGDLIKAEMGISALKFIHEKMIEIAKTRLVDNSLSINDIAYGMGFEYPQHFSRFFKKHVGCSPTDYRKLIMPSENP